MKGGVLNCIIICVISLFLAEGFLRIMGYRPFSPPILNIVSAPKLSIIPNDSLGFALNPGNYTITIDNKLVFTAFHNNSGERITKLGFNEKKSQGKKLLIYGCSFTYGTGVNDSDNFPFLIQKKFSQLNVINKAVPGYGTAQALIQIKKDLLSSDHNDGDIYLLTYFDFHEERNVLSKSYRHKLFLGIEQFRENMQMQETLLNPSSWHFPKLSDDGESLNISFVSEENLFTPFPFREISSLSTFLENKTFGLTYKGAKLNKETKSAIKLMNELVSLRNGYFLVYVIEDNALSRKLVEYCKQQSIGFIEGKLDLSENEMNNLPIDIHPSTKAHKLMAKKLSYPLNQILTNK